MSKSKLLNSFPKVIGAGLLLFLVIVTIDNLFFYDTYSHVRDLIRFYLEPVFALFEIVNLALPIEDTKIYTELMYPRRNDSAIYLIGIPWSILLTFVYTKITIIKKDHFFNLIAFVLLAGLVMFLSSQITTAIFGADFRRFCPGCP